MLMMLVISAFDRSSGPWFERSFVLHEIYTCWEPKLKQQLLEIKSCFYTFLMGARLGKYSEGKDKKPWNLWGKQGKGKGKYEGKDPKDANGDNKKMPWGQ